jgi:hypothetical protein
MTEGEWLACKDPTPMLEFLRGKASDRKLRLFAVAVSRRIWDGLREHRSRQAVEVAERFADGNATAEELLAAHEAAYAAVDDLLPYSLVSEDQALAACGCAAADAEEAAWEANSYGWDGKGLADMNWQQARLLREIFGPLPFRTVPLPASLLAWNDGLVPRLAQAISDERRWADMPILADALLDAGCEDEELIEHCRSAGPHVRGCWAVDVILGKE